MLEKYKTVLAIVFGAALITIALIFQTCFQKYQIAGTGLGSIVRLNTYTGQVSNCTVVFNNMAFGPLDGMISNKAKELAASGFSEEETKKYFTDRQGAFICSQWNEEVRK